MFDLVNLLVVNVPMDARTFDVLCSMSECTYQPAGAHMQRSRCSKCGFVSPPPPPSKLPTRVAPYDHRGDITCLRLNCSEMKCSTDFCSQVTNTSFQSTLATRPSASRTFRFCSAFP